MARSSKVEECMFCGNIPCTCNAPAPKPKAAPRKAKVKSQPEVAAPVAAPEVALPTAPAPKRPDIRAAMQSMAKAAPKPTPVAPVEQSADDDVSPELASALRVFDKLDMIHPDDRKQYAAVLDAPPSTDERIVTWKKKRDYEQAD